MPTYFWYKADVPSSHSAWFMKVLKMCLGAKCMGTYHWKSTCMNLPPIMVSYYHTLWSGVISCSMINSTIISHFNFLLTNFSELSVLALEFRSQPCHLVISAEYRECMNQVFVDTFRLIQIQRIMTSAAFTVYNFKDMLPTVKSLVSVRTTNKTRQRNKKEIDMHQQQTAQYNIKTCIKLVHANYNIDFSQAGREHECLRLSLKNCFGLNKQTNKQTNKQRRTTKTVSGRTFQTLIHVEAHNKIKMFTQLAFLQVLAVLF